MIFQYGLEPVLIQRILSGFEAILELYINDMLSNPLPEPCVRSYQAPEQYPGRWHPPSVQTGSVSGWRGGADTRKLCNTP